MREERTVLVTGATGKQGGAVARALLKSRHRVVAMTRWPEQARELARLGARVVQADFDDDEALLDAMTGVDAVFAMSTPGEGGVEAEVRQGENLAEAAVAAGIRHFIYTSVASANRRTGIPHFETKHKIEQYVRELGLPWTMLRPVFFMENFKTDWFMRSLRQGCLRAPMHPKIALQMISVSDIGEFAASAFSEPERFIGTEIELAGDALTFPEAARILSEAMGAAVLFEPIPEDQAEPEVGRDLALMYRWFNTLGFQVDIAGLGKTYGFSPTKFRTFAMAEWGRVPAAR